jgi:hypothetical protein
VTILFRAGATAVASALFALLPLALPTGAAPGAAPAGPPGGPVAPVAGVVAPLAGPVALTAARTVATGGFARQAAGAAPWLAAGDFDGDRREDLVRLGSADGPAIWFGRSDGAMDRVGIDPPAALDAVTAVDLGGDGVDELLWWSRGGEEASLWRRSVGSRSWSADRLPAPPAGTRPFPLDVDGDGRRDILWHGPAGADALDRGRSGGGFRREEFGAFGTLAPQIGDFDGDRYDDVLWYDPAGGDGAMWWGGPEISAAPFNIGTGMVLHPGQWDGDSDGTWDLLVGGDNGNVVLAGQPDRLFTAEIVPPEVVAGAVVGDVNGDLRSDLIELVGQIGGWNNDASGWLWEPWGGPPIPTGTLADGSWSVLTLDVDGDGADEVLAVPADTAESGSPAAHVWVAGYRREQIFRELNPYAPGGLVVRMLGITAGRRVVPPLTSVHDACGAFVPVHEAIGDVVQAMLSDAAAAGVGICVNSSYRSYDEQVAIRTRRCREVGVADVRDCAYEWRSGGWPFTGGNQIAKPGFSRHQLGIALDLGDLQGYATPTVTGWLSANAHRYGLYNLGDRQRLGPGWPWGNGGEPWHVSIDGR